MITILNKNIISFHVKQYYLDSSDVDYLINHFDIPQLRHEIDTALRKSAYAKDDHDTLLEFYYKEFAEACQLAIHIIRSEQPAPSTKSNSRYVDVEALKRSINIVEIAGRYTKLTKAGKYFTGCCPLHSEKKPSFVVYPINQTWHCYGFCNTGGDVITLVMKAENVDFKDAISRLIQ